VDQIAIACICTATFQVSFRHFLAYMQLLRDALFLAFGALGISGYATTIQHRESTSLLTPTPEPFHFDSNISLPLGVSRKRVTKSLEPVYIQPPFKICVVSPLLICTK
jgi:hypothetical protein